LTVVPPRKQQSSAGRPSVEIPNSGAAEVTTATPHDPNQTSVHTMIKPHLFAVIGSLVLGVLSLSGCGSESDDAAGIEMPRFEDPLLAEGRSVWMGTCRACHLLGVAGAPAVTDYANWEPRIAKGMAALYKGPLLGIKGEDGKYKMPPRAGNDRLSDTQIKRAADYMVAAVQQLHAETQAGAQAN
jgi:cytochrome c5